MTDLTPNFGLPLPAFDTDPWHEDWYDAMRKIDTALLTLTSQSSFDSLYLGAKAADPVLDNQGNALVAGALYFKTGDTLMYVWSGAAWIVAYVPTSGFYTITEVDTLLLAKAALASPQFTGHPRGVTESVGDNSTRLATTAFVKAEPISAAQMPAITGDVTATAGSPVTTLAANVVGDSKLRQSAGLAVIGRAANSTGNVADIVAANDGEILRRSGTSIGFGGISGSEITSGTVPAAQLPIMTTAQYWANTSSKVVSTDQLWAAGALVALSDAATVALDLGTGINFSLTIGGNRTLGAPSNVKVGQSGAIYITQDATGSRTLAYNAAFDFMSGTAPTLSTAIGAIDVIFYHCRTAGSIVITGILKALS